MHDYGNEERNENAQQYSTIYYVSHLWQLIHLELYYWNSFVYEMSGLVIWLIVYLLVRVFYSRYLFPDNHKALLKKQKLKFQQLMKMGDMEDDIIFDGIRETKEIAKQKRIATKAKSMLYSNGRSRDSM